MKRTVDDIEHKHPFTVPDGYFEGLTSKVQERIATSEKQPLFRPVLILKWSIVPLLILITVLGYLRISSPSVQPDFLADVSNEEIIDYLELTGIDETELIALLDHNELHLTVVPLDQLDLDEANLEELIDEFNLDSDYL